jgi:hypothetical protein
MILAFEDIGDGLDFIGVFSLGIFFLFLKDFMSGGGGF